MAEQQEFARSPLVKELFKQLPQTNFYRFCQLIEQLNPTGTHLGTTETPKSDPIRFAPAPEAGFPAAEFKRVDINEYAPERPAVVRTTFLGLYGVDSVLPYSLLDDIVQRQEGHEVLTDFLDIFNHRIITQYYRIWLKYHYPASFASGGSDPVSQCLLGLTGLGIKGTSEQISTPPSRFLALLGLVTQRTRTAEGLVGLVKLLAPKAQVKVNEFYPIWTTIDKPTRLNKKQDSTLDCSVVLGKRFKETNQTVQIIITPTTQEDVVGLLPGEQIHTDLWVLLRMYLGYRFDAQVNLHVQRHLLPLAKLGLKNIRLGQTALLNTKILQKNHVIVSLGRYSGLSA